MRSYCLPLLPYFICLALFSCDRSQLESPRQALRKVDVQPAIDDDLALGPLINGIKEQIKLLSVKNARVDEFTFGEVTFTKDDYLLGLNHFVQLASVLENREEFFHSIKENFDFYEVYGDKDWGDVFITSYFEPVIRGSLRRSKKFSQPLYRVPRDLVEIQLRQFGSIFNSFSAVLKGRVLPEKSPSGAISVGPYFSREEIDSDNVLKGKRLELCWVTPIDAFFLQIQGSGTVILPNGRQLRIGYADQNGHRYEAIGKYLTHKIPLEKMSLQTIEYVLSQMPEKQQQVYFNKNPSYVFFRKLDSKPITYLGSSVVSGRTIATDYRFFPKGALAFMQFEIPSFASTESFEPDDWISTQRFVLDQDTGGAIRGGGRVDLFWGSGDVAKRHAGFMKNRGKLFYLAPKPELIEGIKNF